MLGRALGFSDPEVVRVLKESFIPVVGDDWYQRRRQDDVGRFFRSVVDQTWKAGNWEPGGGNDRQGIYCFTADGKMLTEMKNVGGNPREVRQVLALALRAWNGLPADVRRPGATSIPDPSLDPAYHRPVPAGAIVLREFQRGLKRTDGRLEAHEFTFRDTPVGAQRDHVWILEKEWKAIVPANPAPGTAVELPASLVSRLARFHLVEALIGEPGVWGRDHIREARLTATVEDVTAQAVRLRLEGRVRLSTEPDPSASRCGFDGRLAGLLVYDRVKASFERIDMAAVGDTWGALNPHNGNSRPGRNLIGFWFERAKGPTIPPQGAREVQSYLNP
ncbi:MAG TPA: hypothetical protein VEJ18_22505 [Planctomycetota bacterium]|nr:hypothetical protein [Planctomycetota bacterium]